MKLQKSASLVASAVIVASCAATPAQEAPSPKAQRELADALAGRVQGPAQRCIPNSRASNMQVIDDSIILFRDGRTVYLQRPRSACLGIATGGRTLVMRKVGTTDLCDGDINHTVDLRTGFLGSSCAFGPFVPYTKPRT